MERTTKQFTISLPPDMAEQVMAAAKAESRTISELFREAFRTYRAQSIHTLLESSQEEGRRSKHQGYAPDDVERLIREIRAEDGLDGDRCSSTAMWSWMNSTHFCLRTVCGFTIYGLLQQIHCIG
jgi:hypothetical protein